VERGHVGKPAAEGDKGGGDTETKVAIGSGGMCDTGTAGAGIEDDGSPTCGAKSGIASGTACTGAACTGAGNSTGESAGVPGCAAIRGVPKDGRGETLRTAIAGDDSHVVSVVVVVVVVDVRSMSVLTTVEALVVVSRTTRRSLLGGGIGDGGGDSLWREGDGVRDNSASSSPVDKGMAGGSGTAPISLRGTDLA
jgi:hypothetical protein